MLIFSMPLTSLTTLDPFFGHAGEDCADAFDDEGFSSWYFDQE